MRKEKKVEEQDAEVNTNFKTFMGARVMWPPDVPDDMLKLCITKTTDLFAKYQEDVVTKGNEVNSPKFNFLTFSR